ncbi:DUF3566 domain-containing protein [Blastococcus saxobsidens]|uniref:DUF3566 domain-containing protein n=1 Tax=Blastococcus saxobsidens (strain DD2) TaxID=1146883 RepID=H6RJA7_BLASD|nr:DUF3566 domain-containing protein [Blastococcus saxobsidens]CCG01020.1 conserved exported protein of unknown function [Blastococcus saxobsidens DD2]
MSDRTQGSVRTDSWTGDGASAEGAPTAGDASTTQAIPATGSQRAQGPGTGAAPVVPQPLGPQTGASPAQPAAGAPPAAAAPPPVPAPGSPAAGGTASAAKPATEATGPATGPTSATKPARGRQAGRGPRRARLQLRHIDTWSALKISLVLSIALFFIWMVAVGLLYLVLNGLGVFEAVNDLFGQIGSASGAESSGDVLTPGVIFWGAAVIGAINVVLLTALCTVGTFIYNLCSDLVGGLEVTLSERD